ncbi:MAG: hypothetical protein IPF46_17665 [Saprospiraceae bacterium]|nr:hypothetical protein [Candidatus Vicinibacter affinis]
MIQFKKVKIRKYCGYAALLAITLSQEYKADFQINPAIVISGTPFFIGGVYESMNNDLILQSYFNILLFHQENTDFREKFREFLY